MDFPIHLPGVGIDPGIRNIQVQHIFRVAHRQRRCQGCARPGQVNITASHRQEVLVIHVRIEQRIVDPIRRAHPGRWGGIDIIAGRVSPPGIDREGDRAQEVVEDQQGVGRVDGQIAVCIPGQFLRPAEGDRPQEAVKGQQSVGGIDRHSDPAAAALHFHPVIAAGRNGQQVIFAGRIGDVAHHPDAALVEVGGLVGQRLGGIAAAGKAAVMCRAMDFHFRHHGKQTVVTGNTQAAAERICRREFAEDQFREVAAAGAGGNIKMQRYQQAVAGDRAPAEVGESDANAVRCRRTDAEYRAGNDRAGGESAITQNTVGCLECCAKRADLVSVQGQEDRHIDAAAGVALQVERDRNHNIRHSSYVQCHRHKEWIQI